MASLSNSVKLKYIKLGYQYLVNHILTFFLIPILMGFLIKILSLGPDQIYEIGSSLHFDLLQFLGSSLIIFFATVYFMSKPRSVYLVDYACFKPPASYRVPHATLVEHLRLSNKDNPEIVEFQRRILQRSGLGDETCLAPANLYIPPTPSLEASRAEAELILFSVIDDLLKKTGTKTKDIDILIVNCSVVSPTPSLSAMVINKYKLRSNIKSFNLSGMGCSASLISIDLARDLLQVHPNSCAIVVSTEITTPNYYSGNERSMVLTNCLFRMGGAAILLSNKKADRSRSKYQLLHLVRTHKGADDKAYRCIHEQEDTQGIQGVSLSKDLMLIAGEALKSNITTIGPLAFEHFCIHAGGRGVIDELQKKLQLSAKDVEASRMTLHRFGNTSSSSICGFKCNSAVWKCNRTITTPTDGPWLDCIGRYPVSTSQVLDL
ncbi:hypothetical protein AAG906_030831 [Vitis piasezkii]